ncbi:thiamine phosphate synthase [Lysinibacillus sp. SGAir0095]|uniref:thiamine phosphate synthase n=1 Tax=Lysinibacillus sp. SGAir0095 TaxID=2070463 RepID=UPI0010CD3430|nr:thiamine phosphate synthase [Lysinibacillus sp. SGAir0095]QCR34158.1 thiamine phosphate synthase [Lysinibacillus sp. SGAir0095]
MNRDSLNVYFIMGTLNSSEPLETLEKALKARITCFQLREKGEGSLTGEALESFARACQKLCKAYGVPFIVNDDVELALKLDADGIHVGQDDLAITEFRARAKNKIIGVSVHNEQEMELAVKSGADYVGIGPIYATKSKTDAQPPAGVDFLQKARSQYPNFPIVGIGGINEKNAAEVRSSGADGVSVISVICESPNIEKTIQALSGGNGNETK